jgi:hypothetical protein
VGARWAKNCHPSDLFVTYFTSSKYVAAYIKEHGLPDIVEVTQSFTGQDSKQKVRLTEAEELVRLDAVNRDDYLNKHDGITYSADIVMPHDETVYDWEHTDGTKLSCTRIELVAKYQLHSSSIARIVLRSGLKSHHGWYLADNPPDEFDKTIYDWIHSSGSTDRLSRREMAEKYNISIGETKNIIDGKIRRGWRLSTTTDPKTLPNSRRDTKIYSFTHLDGTTVSMTRQEMIEKYDLTDYGMKALVNGRKKYLGGWRLSENKLTPRSRNDRTLYSFVHENGINEVSTRFDMSIKYGLDIQSIGRVATGDRESHKGWRLSI